jgi:hypothetical protein
MSIKLKLSAGLVAISLAIPVIAFAQSYARQYDGRDYRPQAYRDAERRDDAGVYPEFRDREDRIRRLIRDGVREDLIERDDARDLMGQLRRIQDNERREFAVHRRNLPADDRDRISDQLSRLDRLVDEIRAQD